MSASTSSLSIHSSYDNSNNSNIASLSSQQQQQLQLQQSTSLTSLLHQKLTTNKNNDQQQMQVSSKQVLLNDIASGLADAVAVAVSDAVSSVQQKKCNNLLQQQQQQQPEQTTFSHLRHQLESKDQQQQHALRKNLTNINIEVAVASAVNRYLTSTINKNYRENEIEQVNDNKVISLHV